MMSKAVFVEALFVLTLFVSAALLFLVQPMLGKMLLPVLGGAPAVWNTCMVFFQATLLLGYAYANLMTARVRPPALVVLHLIVILLPLLTLPIGLTEDLRRSVPYSGYPTAWLLGVLAVVGGLPFFVLSTTSPLLQKWFSQIGHPRSADPYFLYAASNVGSLLALLAYPFLIEPWLSTAWQSSLWAIGYGLFACLVGCCAVAAMLGRHQTGRPIASNTTMRDVGGASTADGSPSWWSRALWVASAFVPSSLVLGLTTYISTDVAAVPLMWVLPLALYLLSFVLVFAKKPIRMPTRAARWHGLLTLALTVAIIIDATQPSWMLIPAHFINFLLAALSCHGLLAQRRPAAPFLTQYYFWVSFGGMLGGVFNVFVAPVLFSRPFEYPVMLAASCLLVYFRSERTGSLREWVVDASVAAGLGVLTLSFVLGGQYAGVKPGHVGTLLMFGVPALVAYRWVARPLRFGLGILAVLGASVAYTGQIGKVLHTERNFFGTIRVVQDPLGRYRALALGTTVHGKQSLTSAEECVPLGYFSAKGPAGDVFREHTSRGEQSDVAVLGLGIGSTACYATPAEKWVFYEINPAVERTARNPTYFSLFRLSRARQIEVVLGDARLRLQGAPDAQYGLIVVDTFSSDAIPTHLYSREALTLYVSKLRERGFIAFQVTNRYLDIKPVLAGIAGSLGWSVRCRSDVVLDAEAKASGQDPSEWVVIARSDADLGTLAKDARWKDLSGLPKRQVWTDDYTNMLGLLKWQ